MKITGFKGAAQEIKLKQKMFPVRDNLEGLDSDNSLTYPDKLNFHTQFKTSMSGIINCFHRQDISVNDAHLLISYFKDKLDEMEKHLEAEDSEAALGRDISEGIT